MPSYELVASRSFDTQGGLPYIGMTFPGEGDTVWRVIRIERADELIYTGEPSAPHMRLVCFIES